MATDGVIARVDISSCQLATLSGAKVGDTESRIRALYPGVITSEHKYDDRGHYLTLEPKDDADRSFRLLFETHAGRVTQFRAGRLPEVYLVEGCF